MNRNSYSVPAFMQRACVLPRPLNPRSVQLSSCHAFIRRELHLNENGGFLVDVPAVWW